MPDKRNAPSSPASSIVLCAFFATGFAGLVYQTVWQRILALFSGADVYSITIIVAAFMGGLGCGSLVGGHLADRLEPRQRLWTFAAAESGVAMFGLGSVTIYYDGLYRSLGATAMSRSGTALVIFAVTLIPTFLMGLSLPLLAKFPQRRSASTWIAGLYGWNTLGAALGSLTAATLLFPSFDLRQSVLAAVAGSGLCALAAACVAFQGRHGSWDHLSPATLPLDESVATRESFAVWATLYALSGFVALSLEIVWFRVVGIVLKSNALTFGYLLAVYLVGIGTGATMARHARFSRLDSRRVFLLLQAAVPLWAAGSFIVLVSSIGRFHALSPLSAYLASPLPIARPDSLVFAYVGLPLVLMLPPTLMMGLSFGVLQRTVQTDSLFVGRRVGWLQSANILGSTAGAVMTGIWLLDWFGSAGVLKVLVACGAIFLVLSIVWRRRVTWAGALAPFAYIALIALMPTGNQFWAALHGAQSSDVIVGEGASGVVVFRLDPNETKVFLGGISQSWVPYHGIHTALGALPALLHPDPEQLAVIGLGSGDTLFAIGGRPETRSIESIEIMAAQLPTLRVLAARLDYPALQTLLGDARISYTVADGRARLRRSADRFDIVEADPLLPIAAGSGNVYSVEYFDLLRDHLAPGGFAVTWVPTPRSYASFLTVFPYVLKFGSIAVGSLQPISFDRAALRRRMGAPFTAHYYAAAGIDLERTLEPFVSSPPIVSDPASDRSQLSDVNRDLFPKDEFGIAYRGPLFKVPVLE